MEMFIDFRTLLLTCYGPRFTSGVLFKAHDRSEFWSRIWLPGLHGMMSLSKITVLHINDYGGSVPIQLLPYFVQLEQLYMSIVGMSELASIGGAGHAIGALFASLTPATTLACACPALRSIGLQGDIDHDTFPYTELQAMAAARHQRGLPLRRFAYQFHGRANLPLSTEEERMALIETSLSPLLQPYVDAIAYRLSSSAEKPLCPFVLRRCWRVPDAEKYWRVPSRKKPTYGVPQAWDWAEPDADGDAAENDSDESEDSGRVYDLATLFNYG